MLTFDTTAAAIALERLCAGRGLPGRLIPTPRSITADCGMAWSAPPESREAILAAAAEAGLRPAGEYMLLL